MTSTLISLALLAALWLTGANLGAPAEPASNAPGPNTVVSNSGSDDLVVLKSGKKIKGRVIREGPQEDADPRSHRARFVFQLFARDDKHGGFLDSNHARRARCRCEDCGFPETRPRFHDS